MWNLHGDTHHIVFFYLKLYCRFYQEWELKKKMHLHSFSKDTESILKVLNLFCIEYSVLDCDSGSVHELEKKINVRMLPNSLQLDKDG